MYFTVSEAVANALKHAEATKIEVRLARTAGRLRATVSDDGKGFDAGRPGLATLADRLDALGGGLDLDSEHGKGDTGGRLGAGRWLRRSGRSWPTTTTWCGRAPGGCWRCRARSPSSGAVGNADELLDAVRRLGPEVVITDIRMPGGRWRQGFEGIDAAHRSAPEHPGVGRGGAVAVLRRAVRPGAVQARHRGVAYLLKDRVGDLDELLGAIRAVASGGSVIDPKVVEGLLAGTTCGASTRR